MSVIEVEERATKRDLKRVSEIEAVAAALSASKEAVLADRLRKVVADEWKSIAPVRVRVAGAILGLDDKTVRAWLHAGVLDAVGGTRRVLVTPESLHRVHALVGDLRRAGQTRGLLDAVWRRLTDEDTLADPAVQESLEQLRRGDVAPLRVPEHMRHLK